MEPRAVGRAGPSDPQASRSRSPEAELRARPPQQRARRPGHRCEGSGSATSADKRRARYGDPSSAPGLLLPDARRTPGVPTAPAPAALARHALSDRAPRHTCIKSMASPRATRLKIHKSQSTHLRFAPGHDVPHQSVCISASSCCISASAACRVDDNAAARSGPAHRALTRCTSFVAAAGHTAASRRTGGRRDLSPHRDVIPPTVRACDEMRSSLAINEHIVDQG